MSSSAAKEEREFVEKMEPARWQPCFADKSAGFKIFRTGVEVIDDVFDELRR
jgi:hypothetical protein